MDNEERMRRKKIWEALPDSEKQKIEQERADISAWAIEEEEKTAAKLIEEGRYLGGLDGKYPELEAISQEASRRLGALLVRVFGES